jgi:hypothetical protein
VGLLEVVVAGSANLRTAAARRYPPAASNCREPFQSDEMPSRREGAPFLAMLHFLQMLQFLH